MFRAPRPAGLPHFQSIVDNIGATDEQLAKLLGMKPATIRKYRQDGQAPRTVMLALFWETTWGISAVDAEATNWARRYYTENQILKRKNDRLVKQLLTLESALSNEKTGAANTPVFEIG